MNTSPTKISGSSQSFSVYRWLLAFFAPTYAMVCVTLFSLSNIKLSGEVIVILLGLANLCALVFCAHQIGRMARPSSQRISLVFATVLGLGVQYVVDVVGFGILALELWGFPGPS